MINTKEIPTSLDASKPQKVEYCVPMWLRDEQIKINIANVKGRIEPHQELKSEPIAIVCYGASLNDTWEKIKGFNWIMSCSGAHKFLIERGIIPTWHVEVDPRKHKIELLGTPHKDVEYLPASACHPDYFKHLAGYKVKMWHVFDAAEQIPILPKGDWMLTGGCSVGLRCMTLARFFGFREMHIFGMDGCEGKTGQHAAAHPNQSKKTIPCEYNGKTYFTTPAFLEAARGTFHELDELKDVKAIFYGDGLVQEMAKDYKPKHPEKIAVIAFNKPETISTEALNLNIALHKDALNYGVGGGRYANIVLKLAKSLITKENPIPSVLDYGCGKGYLAKALSFPIWEYDPAISEKSAIPRPADLVVCTDVLEHVEYDKIDFVLDDLKRCVKQVGYFIINTLPAKKSYSDGRNTHLILENKEWWEKKISKYFVITLLKQNEHIINIVVGHYIERIKNDNGKN